MSRTRATKPWHLRIQEQKYRHNLVERHDPRQHAAGICDLDRPYDPTVRGCYRWSRYHCRCDYCIPDKSTKRNRRQARDYTRNGWRSEY